ncbi:methyltransferase [Astrocystis sublimbata]|nr:methyltransferase [Astrocystis sublimbata]
MATTTAVFNLVDLSTHHSGTRLKPWTKVDASGTSYDLENITSPVHSFRDAAPSEFNTDVTGFGLVRWPTGEKAFVDDEAVRGAYYDDVVALLKANCALLPSNSGTGKDGADNKVRKVVIFDHTIRRRVEGAARAPVQQVHVDQTPAAAVARVRRHLPAEEAEELLKHRFQLINVWRPISHAATDHPLAVIDWRSTVPQDFTPIDLLYPKRATGQEGDDDDRGKEKVPTSTRFAIDDYEVRGETMGVLKNENHRYYYVKDMAPEEALLLKCYDSWGEGEPGGKQGLAVRTPHTAFVDPATPPDAKPRESIEVRALVFYEE